MVRTVFTTNTTESTPLNTEKTSEVEISSIIDLLNRQDKNAEQLQKLNVELQAAESQADVMQAAKQSRKLQNTIDELKRAQELISQRLENSCAGIDTIVSRLEDLDEQTDREHNQKELQAFNELANSAEGKAAAIVIAAMIEQWQRCQQSRYTPFIKSEAVKVLMNPSAHERQTAHEQLVTPPQREPTSPELVAARDAKQRIADMGISAPYVEPARRGGVTVCEKSRQEVLHEKRAPQRRLSAMNRISNGDGTDADRELLEQTQPIKQSIEYSDSDPAITEIH